MQHLCGESICALQPEDLHCLVQVIAHEHVWEPEPEVSDELWDHPRAAGHRLNRSAINKAQRGCLDVSLIEQRIDRSLVGLGVRVDQPFRIRVDVRRQHGGSDARGVSGTVQVPNGRLQVSLHYQICRHPPIRVLPATRELGDLVQPCFDSACTVQLRHQLELAADHRLGIGIAAKRSQSLSILLTQRGSHLLMRGCDRVALDHVHCVFQCSLHRSFRRRTESQQRVQQRQGGPKAVERTEECVGRRGFLDELYPVCQEALRRLGCGSRGALLLASISKPLCCVPRRSPRSIRIVFGKSDLGASEHVFQGRAGHHEILLT